MSKVVAWLNVPLPPRKRWQVLLSAALDTLGNNLRDHRVKDLERRIEALERKR